MALSMLGYIAGECIERPARRKVSPPNSKRTKPFLQSQTFDTSKYPKPKSVVTTGLEASGSRMNSEPEMPPLDVDPE